MLMKKLNTIQLLLMCYISLLSIQTSAQVVEVIGGLSAPHGLAIDQANHLYISQSSGTNGNKISFIVLTDTNPIVSDLFVTNLNTPTKLKLSADNFLYFAESNSNFGRISRANIGGTSSPIMAPYYSTGLVSPMGLDVVGNNMFIGDYGNYAIKKINTSITPFQSTILAYDLATDIVIDGEFIHYTNPTSAEVKSNTVINPSPIASSITSGIANPSSLLLNNGILYVSDATNGKIYRSNIIGSSINSELIASGLNQPQSMVLFNNELYITESGANRIVKLNLSNLGNENFESTLSLTVFPNPTQSILNIQTKKTISEIYVFNMLGKKMNINQISMSQLDISNLDNGIYIIKLIGENNQSFSAKFSKF